MKKSAILLVSCPDRKGIVATVADFLYKHNANILHADEHIDADFNLFFLRVEWDLTDFDLPRDQFVDTFNPIAKKFQMEWRVEYSQDIQKVAIFVSQELHCLEDLLYRYRSGELKCDISLIISNHSHANEYAEFSHVPFFEISHTDKVTAEEKITQLLNKNNVDLIILARYMQILSPMFVKKYSNRVINIHHSFLPAFVGARPYHQAHERGVKIIGATSHYVTESLDQGPIIEQDVIRVSHRDAVADLIQKGKDLEKIVLSRAVRWHLENKILTYANKTVIFD
ncbi:formyltetrahydrofolate deformylase [Candidatus Gottesmanbacteria bacterium]|nr:formyltetrahydrofolate deformylase [Candidatus Gottesmanbacteria bacterium]